MGGYLVGSRWALVLNRTRYRVLGRPHERQCEDAGGSRRRVSERRRHHLGVGWVRTEAWLGVLQAVHEQGIPVRGPL